MPSPVLLRLKDVNSRISKGGAHGSEHPNLQETSGWRNLRALTTKLGLCRALGARVRPFPDFPFS
jgi:hypothetical protein